MDSIDKWALIVVGSVFGLIILWAVLEPVLGFLGLLFGSDKKKRD